MRFANIREMHQPSAVGIAEEAAIDDKGLYLGARIVDHDAWQKVVAGVYKGFSIGGHVTARDPADRNIVTGLALSEISVVDRPANPEAVFDCWKRAAATVDPPPHAGDGRERAERVGAAAPGRLRALLAELCDLLDSFSPENADDIAALALSGSLRKLRRGDDPDMNARVAKLADDIRPRLDALPRRVEGPRPTPVPPLTVTSALRGLSAIAKRDDGAGAFVASDDIVAALAQMTDEERTLALIKAARATPLRPMR